MRIKRLQRGLWSPGQIAFRYPEYAMLSCPWGQLVVQRGQLIAGPNTGALRVLTNTLRRGGLIGIGVRMLAVPRKQHTTKAF